MDAEWIKNLPGYAFRRRPANSSYGIVHSRIERVIELIFDALRALEQNAVRETHVPILGADKANGPPGQLPPVEAVGATPYIVFDLAAGTQKVYRVFKIPHSYLADAQLHIHWTKSDDVDRSGEVVRWLVSYTIFDGRTEDAAATPTVLTFDDTFLDNGTTSRVVQRIADQALANPTAAYYVGIAVEKGTPDPGPTAMAEPALVSLDFTYKESVL